MNGRSKGLVVLLAVGMLAATATPRQSDCADKLPTDRVSVSFNLENRRKSPFPSDVFTVDDPKQLTGRRVALPLTECDLRPNDCEDWSVINTLDGFGGSPRVSIPFNGMVLANISSNTVFLLRLDDSSERVPGNYWTWDPQSCTLHFRVDGLLQQHTQYGLVITSGVRDLGGRPVISPGFDRFRRELNTTNDHYSAYRKTLLEALRTTEAAGIADVVAMSVFTTRSVTSSLEKIREDVLSQPPGAADFTLSDGTRLAFPINDIGAIVINRHVNGSVENPTFLPQNFSRASILAFANIAPGAIAYLAFGKYRSPEYRDATRTFPVDGTRVWQPRRQGMTDIYFSLFLPSGQKPPGGWPVVIYGAGSRGSILEAANYASINASRGLATISINGVGSGWGPLTTLTLTRISGTSTTFEWKGRGLDENGDGIILGGEGRVATHHDILGASDSNQQYIVDLMQFVRVVEAGLDWDGDGSADLNPSQILYEGHSYGATIGSMLVALEPAVKAAVFFSGNGANSWKAVGLIPGVRNVLGVAFASRMPSILTSPGISCLDHLPLSPSTTCIEGLPVPTTEPAVLWNENMPARDAAPLVLTVVGATAIQEWFDNRNWVRQPGEGGAYTVFLRKRPLPGRQPTPVIIGVARGDYAVPNPSAWDAVRAGELEDRVTFFRNDVAVALDSRMPKDPHRFSWLSDPESPTSSPLRAQTGRLIQTQAAVFLASLGTNTIDPDGTGPLFETPIPLPLPDGMHFIP